MKTPNIQNVFKMMIGTSALIASTAFFINTISPAQANENKEFSVHSELTKTKGLGPSEGTIVGCGSGIYEYDYWGKWKKVGP